MASDLVVVGGGISGLSLAAFAVQRGWRVQLLEAEPRLGGCLHTFRTADGFWLELGAHTLFNSYPTLLRLLALAGLKPQDLEPLASRPFRLWADGRLHSVAGAIHWLELVASLPRLPFLRREGRRVDDYFSAIAGRRNFANVFGPAFDAVICQPAAPFPADRLFKRRPRHRDFPRRFTLPGGMMTLPERLGAGLEVATDAAVVSISASATGYRCETADGRRYEAKRLGVAVPPDSAARLLRPINPALAELLSEVRVSPVNSLGVVVEAAQLQLPPVGGLIGRDAPFYSVVSRDGVAHARYRGFTFHFRPGIDDPAVVAAEVLKLPAEAWVASAPARHQLPALRPGHTDWLRAVERALQEQPIALTGNYFDGVSIEDCVNRSWQALSRLP